MTKLEQIEVARQELLARIYKITDKKIGSTSVGSRVGRMSVEVTFYNNPPELVEEAESLDWVKSDYNGTEWCQPQREDRGTITIFYG